MQEQRDAYFKAVKENQTLKFKLKRKRNSSVTYTASTGEIIHGGSQSAALTPSALGARKSSQLKPSDRFNTYTVHEEYGVGKSSVGTTLISGRNGAKNSVLSDGSGSLMANKIPSGKNLNPQVVASAVRNIKGAMQGSYSRHLSIEEKEAGYNRQLKKREKEIDELQREVEITKSKLSRVNQETGRLTDELAEANEVSKLQQIKRETLLKQMALQESQESQK